ncbi:MAG: Crp/Fnr family transcriptional regulator [Chryseobacterium sp.]|jgi:CRP-like cAMP-binding protein|uniref:Crp/Fnr family transcriptional regulator n=1 Tax=Chryseobacterium sp. TaxID=1871047 RepID=UPI002829D106|nr:Crp/Fnr family transcriptional regulator [Chryseobacterium sp.]MDR2235686.1 Crp/Fnr family transcriptional regulator [Chryseobacterium sp.]
MIPEQLLKEYGAQSRAYETGDFIYEEHMGCCSYFQIVSGKVKLNNLSEDGKEFIQNIFEAPQSFGEVLLFIHEPYPTNAIALTECTVLELPEQSFLNLLEENPIFSVRINENLSRRLYYKMIMSQHIFSKDPVIRIKALMDYFKRTHDTGHSESGYLIPLTRQQMADLTGLRVETVIRTIKVMEKENLLKIKNRRIYY